MNHLPLRGQSPGPLFLLSSGQLLSRTLLTHWLKDPFSLTVMLCTLFVVKRGH